MSDELQRQKRKKLIMYIVAFIIFQTLVIVVMSFTVMKIRTPKYRIRSAEFQSFNYSASNNSFNMMMNARLRVKNMNFGTFKYDASNIAFYYGDVEVGIAVMPKSKAGWLSSKKFNVLVPLSSSAVQSNSNLGTDLNSGGLPLTVKSKLSGKVRLMFMFKKKKSTKMNCTFGLNLNTRQIENMKC